MSWIVYSTFYSNKKRNSSTLNGKSINDLKRSIKPNQTYFKNAI